jgi:hypothetical protein
VIKKNKQHRSSISIFSTVSNSSKKNQMAEPKKRKTEKEVEEEINPTEPDSEYQVFLDDNLVELISQMTIGEGSMAGVLGLAALASTNKAHSEQMAKARMWSSVDIGEIASASHPDDITASQFAARFARSPCIRVCTRLTGTKLSPDAASALALHMPLLQTLALPLSGTYTVDGVRYPVATFLGKLAVVCPNLTELDLGGMLAMGLPTVDWGVAISFPHLLKLASSHSPATRAIILGSGKHITDLVIRRFSESPPAPGGMDILAMCPKLDRLVISLETMEISLVGAKPCESVATLEIRAAALAEPPSELARVFPRVKSLNVWCALTPEQVRAIGDMPLVTDLAIIPTPVTVSEYFMRPEMTNAIGGTAYATALAAIGNNRFGANLNRVKLGNLNIDPTAFFSSKRCEGVLTDLTLIRCRFPNRAAVPGLANLTRYSDSNMGNAWFTADVIKNAKSLQYLELQLYHEPVAIIVLSERNTAVRFLKLTIGGGVTAIPPIRETYPALEEISIKLRVTPETALEICNSVSKYTSDYRTMEGDRLYVVIPRGKPPSGMNVSRFERRTTEMVKTALSFEYTPTLVYRFIESW